MDGRLVSGREDIFAVQQLASRLWPHGWHPGGLGWALARGQLGHEVALFGDGAGALAGWAARDQHAPGELLAQVDPAHPEAAGAAVAWLLECAEGDDLAIEVPAGADVLRAALAHTGFTPRPGMPVYAMRRSAGAPAAASALARGYAVRAVGADERAARVDVHRAAWRPASLPWHPDHQVPVDPDATSSFTAADYDAVRDTWLYDRDLDLVAVAPDGSLAACCIAWFDPATGVAEIEPLGVAPEHRRQGLAVALCHDAAARVRANGGRQLFINTGPREEYPGPAGAYAKAGFETYERASTYVLERGR